jgi:hypothetical protein
MIFKHRNRRKVRSSSAMITSRGKNGAKIIHVDIEIPPPMEEQTEEELQMSEIDQILTRLEGVLLLGDPPGEETNIEGYFDDAKEAFRKFKESAKNFKDKAADKIKRASKILPPLPGSQSKVTVELPEKYYDQMERIIAIFQMLVETMVNPGGNGEPSAPPEGPSQNNSVMTGAHPGAAPNTRASSAITYVIQRDPPR